MRARARPPGATGSLVELRDGGGERRRKERSRPEEEEKPDVDSTAGKVRCVLLLSPLLAFLDASCSFRAAISR